MDSDQIAITESWPPQNDSVANHIIKNVTDIRYKNTELEKLTEHYHVALIKLNTYFQGNTRDERSLYAIAKIPMASS